MPARLAHRVHAFLERRLPEQRLFLKSDTETRFIRLKPVTQAVVLSGIALLLAWTVVATSIVVMESIGAGGSREQAQQKQATYERRLDEMSRERDLRAAEAAAAQERFAIALGQVSQMQAALLTSEERRNELETGIGVIQSTLKSTMKERDAARMQVAQLTKTGEAKTASETPDIEDVSGALSFLTAALDQTAKERDSMADVADSARQETQTVAYEMRLLEERHAEIFSRLEDAVTVSMEPLDKMFTAAGMDPDDLIDQIRQGYSGQGGPIGPLLPPLPEDETNAGAIADHARANAILDGLDRMNMYRIAAEKLPFAMPLNTSFRFTSPFGRRWGRMHEGADLAGAHGSPIYSTADGVVVHAGPESGYGNLVTIRHSFGLETRYGHLSAINVKKGQKVSRGEKIGAMGNTGRSTGTHLHYEVRVNGKAVNPMTYIKAGKNVF
ncbi:M23 family metallopeptidase [Defluviimonas sp. WL0002]|uniref:M23 family metallopeptidase n=1 Tax=Albidovulum marisflavi TaxID=2984159 RepID=A0ABT2ZH70_9RHOB|nr:M23 family metallopeptidase [Defluviimonas sp. WL0002]MCV2870456.1 M23 family metallopeptidase [Defluviimonas sp. WL0002]